MWNLVIRPQKRLFLIFLIVTFLHAFITIAYAKVIEFLTQVITGKVQLAFGYLVIFCLVFASLTALINVIGGYFKGRVINGAMQQLRQHVFNHFLTTTALKDATVGAKVSYLTAKADVIEQTYIGSFVTGLSLFCQLLLALGFAFAINGPLTLMVLVLEIPAVLLPFLSQNRLKRAKAPVLRQLEAYTATVTNWLSGLTVIRNFGREPRFKQRHANQTCALTTAQNQDVLVRKIISGWSQFFSDLVYLGTWLIGGLFVRQYGLSFAAFIGFTQLSSAISFPLEMASDVFTDYFGGRRAYLEFGPLLTAKTGRQPRRIMPFSTTASHFITYDHATIADQQHPLLKDVTLSIDRCEKIIVIGESGAGKSTLVNTLFGTHHLTAGTITINGQSLSTLTTGDVSQLISFQEQATFIFDGTVADNLTLFQSGYTPQQLLTALKTAGITATPDFLKTNVSTTGSRLSGGERQRIGLARNLLAAKPFMIFDELSSGLDKATATMLEQKLFSLNVGFIYITHNYDTNLLHQADRVLCVKNQQVVPYII
ncbi:ATP-binding cassette domain-containing protein [Levilactobacillus enshiensis]|uniref:ATP-binding cassette domain-containing protein n=1 Tax=Levilactobacillus enshiensis TaxID=2590213 RepID=UPI00117BAB8D|nr:ABC transporter ATP-binding protein [Levilactobacillus enshiensis]